VTTLRLSKCRPRKCIAAILYIKKIAFNVNLITRFPIQQILSYNV